MICLLQPLYADHFQSPNLNKLHRESRIRDKTERSASDSSNSSKPSSYPCLYSQRPKPISLVILSIQGLKHLSDPSYYIFCKCGLRLGTNYWCVLLLLTMGCISSKIIARSLSYHEERKQGSRRSANGIPLLEDIIISANGGDQYLAFVLAANKVSNELHSRSFSSNTSPKPDIESASSETIEKLEISSRLDQEGGKRIESDENMSKSWHCFPDHIVSSLAKENLIGFEDQHDLSSKGVMLSRSFHTVEDYDDMVNKIWLSKNNSVEQSEFNGEEENGSVTNMDLQVSEDKDSAIKKMQPPSLSKKYSLEESEVGKEKSILSTASENGIVSSIPKSHISSSAIKNEELVPSQRTNMLYKGASAIEKGNKIKALAKRLESLRVPSDIESPAIASLRQWLPAGGIYSPGSYVTPKFGSYSLMDMRNANESSESEDSIFSPELVSAFEQCMQKLNADEENFLKQIMENEEEESDEGMQPKERTLDVIGE